MDTGGISKDTSAGNLVSTAIVLRLFLLRLFLHVKATEPTICRRPSRSCQDAALRAAAVNARLIDRWSRTWERR